MIQIWFARFFSRVLFPCFGLHSDTHKEYGAASHDISGVGGVFLYVTLKLKEKKMPTFT